jgi:hypothetical protein
MKTVFTISNSVKLGVGWAASGSMETEKGTITASYPPGWEYESPFLESSHIQSDAEYALIAMEEAEKLAQITLNGLGAIATERYLKHDGRITPILTELDNDSL